MALAILKENCTVEEYMELEKTSPIRHEYVDGQVYAMTGETKNHNRILADLFRELNDQLANRKCEAFIENVKVKVRPALFYYPDLAVSCESLTEIEDEDEYVVNNPIMIVEVLSKSTERTDRNEKMREYKNIDSLREYVIIAQDRMRVEIYRRSQPGEDWRGEIYGGAEKEALFESVGAKVKLADIYKRVRFSETPELEESEELR